jgi:hypothetical protein
MQKLYKVVGQPPWGDFTEAITKASKEKKDVFLRILLLGFSTLDTLGLLAHFRH